MAAIPLRVERDKWYGLGFNNVHNFVVIDVTTMEVKAGRPLFLNSYGHTWMGLGQQGISIATRPMTNGEYPVQGAVRSSSSPQGSVYSMRMPPYYDDVLMNGVYGFNWRQYAYVDFSQPTGIAYDPSQDTYDKPWVTQSFYWGNLFGPVVCDDDYVWLSSIYSYDPADPFGPVWREGGGILFDPEYKLVGYSHNIYFGQQYGALGQAITEHMGHGTDGTDLYVMSNDGYMANPSAEDPQPFKGLFLARVNRDFEQVYRVQVVKNTGNHFGFDEYAVSGPLFARDGVYIMIIKKRMVANPTPSPVQPFLPVQDYYIRKLSHADGSIVSDTLFQEGHLQTEASPGVTQLWGSPLNAWGAPDCTIVFAINGTIEGYPCNGWVMGDGTLVNLDEEQPNYFWEHYPLSVGPSGIVTTHPSDLFDPNPSEYYRLKYWAFDGSLIATYTFTGEANLGSYITSFPLPITDTLWAFVAYHGYQTGGYAGEVNKQQDLGGNDDDGND